MRLHEKVKAVLAGILAECVQLGMSRKLQGKVNIWNSLWGIMDKIKPFSILNEIDSSQFYSVSLPTEKQPDVLN